MPPLQRPWRSHATDTESQHSKPNKGDKRQFVLNWMQTGAIMQQCQNELSHLNNVQYYQRILDDAIDENEFDLDIDNDSDLNLESLNFNPEITPN